MMLDVFVAAGRLSTAASAIDGNDRVSGDGKKTCECDSVVGVVGGTGDVAGDVWGDLASLALRPYGIPRYADHVDD